MAAGGGAPPAPGEMAAVPDEAASPEAALLAQAGEEGMEGAEEGAPSEEALEAVKAGVTPEELAQAAELLASQEAMAGAAAEEEAGAETPVEGEEEKDSQMGAPMGGMGGAGMMPPPSPPPTM